MRRLKPLIAALAITEPKFMTPGAHPVHTLLDQIQDRGIGWQSRLERMGASLEQQIMKAVDDSRRWFEDHGTDLNAIYGQIAEELSSQYTVGYTSRNIKRDGSWRRIVVRVSRTAAAARTKQGYFAPTR